MTQEDYDFLYKIVLIGESGVGKSNLLLRFTRNEFDAEKRSTMGVEFATRSIQHDNKVIRAQIWDTAGQERFRTITSSYYRGAHGIIVVYDVTDRKSFNSIPQWLNEIELNATPNIIKIMIGNKADAVETKEISTDQAIEFAQKNDMKFFETSAKAATNVEETFIEMARMIKHQLNESSSLTEETLKEKGLFDKD